MKNNYWLRLKLLTEERMVELKDAIDRGKVPKRFDWWYHKTLQSNIAWNNLAIEMIADETNYLNNKEKLQNIREMKIKTFRGNDE